ncbi:hypothetical protein [Saccharopolyspora sp. CA-218241]|uniref:hypothetical protein n=1 Tax=Saccharopolyspora sp. CA-218241 TaxID=3240027 RepID=UPI003D990A20
MSIRTTAIALTAVLCAALLGGAGYVRLCVANTNCAQAQVRVIAGSEKTPFFTDPRVRDALADHGLDVQVTGKGSRDLHDQLEGYDLAFPSSALAAERIIADRPGLRRESPFFSPMVVATYTDFAEALRQAGIARPGDRPGTWVFDVAAYLEQVQAGLRWQDIPGVRGQPASNGNLVLVATTNPRSSNSAAMYIAITSNVWNGGRIAQPEDIPRLAPLIGEKLFAAQGTTGLTSEEPFDVYTAPLGKSRAPMVLLYEAQFIGARITDPGRITDDMVLMYPTPTVVADHSYVPLSPEGEELGRLLGDDPELIRLAVEHGFRPLKTETFTEVLREQDVTVPSQLDVVQAPAYDTLEGLIDAIQ